jgi:hypothetical protein
MVAEQAHRSCMNTRDGFREMLLYPEVSANVKVKPVSTGSGRFAILL